MLKTEEVFKQFVVELTGEGVPSNTLVNALRDAMEYDALTRAVLQEEARVHAQVNPDHPSTVTFPEYERRYLQAMALCDTFFDLLEKARQLRYAFHCYQQHLRYVGAYTASRGVPVLIEEKHTLPDTTLFNEIYLAKLSPELRGRACLHTGTGLVEISLQDPPEVELPLPEPLRRPPFVLRYDSDGNDP